MEYSLAFTRLSFSGVLGLLHVIVTLGPGIKDAIWYFFSLHIACILNSPFKCSNPRHPVLLFCILFLRSLRLPLAEVTRSTPLI
jgi:hypothetical protein